MTACDVIRPRMGALFTCTQHGRYVRIHTPFMYPDGDYIDLFVLAGGDDDAGPFTVTDLGETLRWLRMQTPAAKRSPKQTALLQDVCLTQGVELFSGMLTIRVNGPEELSMGVVKLAQAAIRAADLWFTFRGRAVESITDEVAEFLSEHGIPFERGQRLVGRSGRVWNVDFHTRTPARSALTNVLTSGSRASARGVVEHVVTTWWDLSNLQVGPEGLHFVSLFDDTVDVWTPEDFTLLEPLSTIARWSRPDEYEGILKAA